VDGSRLLSNPEDKANKIQVLVTVGLMAALSLALAVLGICVKKEYRVNENRGRNYLPNGGRLVMPSFSDASEIDTGLLRTQSEYTRFVS
jgi:hypothetical protein